VMRVCLLIFQCYGLVGHGTNGCLSSATSTVYTSEMVLGTRKGDAWNIP
jgi:NifU-like protein involved in Fe-S cluster formation